MAIDNITKNNTVDEWRIQTNQSAAALNTIETGDYTKSNGILTLNANASLIITSNGTALQVSNTVLFQTRLEVGNTIALGVRESGTGNLTVGNTVFIYGSGNALFVANNATVNNNLQVTNSLTTTNVTANNTITVGRNLLMTNTGNVIFANTGGANIQTIYVTDGYAKNVYTDIIEVSNYADVGSNATIGSFLTVGSFLIVGSYSNVTSFLNIGSFANVGTYLKTGSNVSVGTYLDVTGNTTTGNLNTSGVANSDTLKVASSGTIGTTLSVTGNITGGNIISGGTSNLKTILGETLEITNTAFIDNLDVTGDFTISGNVIYDTDKLVISASTPKDAGFATFGVYRTGSNAEIRWAASSKEWQLRDVDNPTSYSKILTSNLISDSIISTSSSTIASSNAANQLGISIVSANTAMKSYVDARTTSNIAEGTNLYLTATRVRSNVSYADGAAGYNSSTGVFNIPASTSNVAEGTNLYLTATRVRANVSNTTPINYDSSTGTFSHASSGVVTATHGSASQVPVFAINSFGHITSVTNTAIAISSGAVSGLAASATTDTTNATNISSGTLNSARLPTTGTAGTYGTATQVPVFTTDVNGRVSSVTNTPIAISYTAVSGLAASAITDTTDATNISTGTLNALRLPTTGTAGNWGSNIIIPVFSTDSYGRVSSVSNTGIRAATTSVTGVVQLTDSISSTSTTTAATANAVNAVYSYAQTKSSAVTINNGTGISGGGTSNVFTLSIGQSVATTANAQFRTIGVNTTADSANAGSIRATGDITAFFSDERLKEDIVIITDALDKVNSIRGVHYTPNDVAVTYGYRKDRKVGVIAQDIEKVLPEVVVTAPFDIDENGGSKSGENYKTVQYDRIIPLLIEAIKELSIEVEDLKKQINK